MEKPKIWIKYTDNEKNPFLGWSIPDEKCFIRFKNGKDDETEKCPVCGKPVKSGWNDLTMNEVYHEDCVEVVERPEKEG